MNNLKKRFDVLSANDRQRNVLQQMISSLSCSRRRRGVVYSNALIDDHLDENGHCISSLADMNEVARHEEQYERK